MRESSGLKFAEVRALAHALPGVEDGTSYGTPALKAGGKLLARLWEDGTTLVLRVPFVVRDHLVLAQPTVYFLTEHYRAYPYVLVRLPEADRTDLAALLEEAWRQVASKRVIAAYDAARGDAGA